MPRLDDCHDVIVRALEKAGWMVAPKSPRFVLKRRLMIVDIEAEKPSNGRSASHILVEVKCLFEKDSGTTGIYLALGQYIMYRAMLRELKEVVDLYLAVPEAIYEAMSDSVLRRAILENEIKLIVVDLERELIKRWIE